MLQLLLEGNDGAPERPMKTSPIVMSIYDESHRDVYLHPLLQPGTSLQQPTCYSRCCNVKSGTARHVKSQEPSTRCSLRATSSW